MGRRPKGEIPALKISARGRGYVNINGKKHDLGRYGTLECQAAYLELAQRWTKAEAEATPYVAPDSPTVGELYREFYVYATARYRRDDGTPTSEAKSFNQSLTPFLERYRAMKADQVGQKELKAVRAEMIAAGLARKTVNQRIGRIRRLFRWGVGESKVDAVVVTRLESVRDLEAGYSGVADRATPGAVPLARVEATLPFLNRHHQAMVRLQLMTGARPGEVCAIKGADIDHAGVVRLKSHEVQLPGGAWVWQPIWHKAKRRGKALVYVLGPQARQLLTPWLRADPAEHLFQPGEARAEHDRRRSAAAKRKGQSGAPRRVRKFRPCYSVVTYGKAIAAAARAAGIAHWRPHQLRKLVASQTDRLEGIESSRKRLGHSSITTTEIYVETDLKEAARMAEAYG